MFIGPGVQKLMYVYRRNLCMFIGEKANLCTFMVKGMYVYRQDKDAMYKIGKNP